MKATGIVRHLDPLGRLVLPIELRRTLGLKTRDGVEIFVSDDNHIVLRKYQAACVFCGECDDVALYRSQRVCGRCRRDLGQQVGTRAAATPA